MIKTVEKVVKAKVMSSRESLTDLDPKEAKAIAKRLAEDSPRPLWSNRYRYTTAHAAMARWGRSHWFRSVASM